MKEWRVSDSDAILREAVLLARTGRLDEAERMLAAADQGNSKIVRGHGQILAALARWSEALECFAAVLKSDPKDLDAWLSLGSVARMSGRHADALEAYDRVLADRPNDAVATRAKAELLVSMARADLAEPIFAVLAKDDLISALRHFACLVALGRKSEAEALYGNAPQTFLQDAEATLSLARDGLNLGASSEAERWYRRTLELSPNNVEALTGIGSTLVQRGERQDGQAFLRRAVSVDPKAVYARELLATALHDDRQDAGARLEIDGILALEPKNAQAHALLAYAAIRRIGKTRTPQGSERAEIIDNLRTARDARPTDSALVLSIAELLNRFGLAGEAASTLKTLWQANPQDVRTCFAAARATINVCDWQHYDELRLSVLRTADAALPAGTIDDEGLRILTALGADYAVSMGVARRLARRHEAAAKAVLPMRPPRARLRVGYLQAQTKFHSTMAVARGLVERHDRNGFEVFGYARHDREDGSFDAFQDGYRKAFDDFRDLSALDDATAAQRIAEDNIDVLIELNGPGAENSMGVIAHRPARVIVHYYGHAYGTGAAYIDYLLVDHVYMPDDLAALGTEAPIFVPPCFMAAMPGQSSNKALTRRELGLPENAVVFANFNHPWKFEPRAFRVWAEILKALPQSILWTAKWNDKAGENLAAEFRRSGLDPARLIVAPTAAHDDHLARLALADLALDPFMVAGGVTTFDALRAGLPVIARKGAVHTPSARMGASIVTAAGLGELVANSDDAYVAIALELARNREKRLALRAELPRRTAKALDLTRSTRHLEAALEAVWQRHVEGVRPAAIEIKEAD